jgi:hypothetical protein
MAKADTSSRVETIAEECHCFTCGRRWKVVLDGKMGKIPEKYIEEYEAHVEDCIRKPKEAAEKRRQAIKDKQDAKRGYQKGG